MKKNRRIKLETTMILMLNAFTIGILIEEIITNGLSWISTIGYLG